MDDKVKHKFDEEIEKHLCRQLINNEVDISDTNQQSANDEYEVCISLLDAERREKDYDWMSDIRIPEFASHVLTQSSVDVGQYFQTRDFCEVYLEEGSEIAKANADAAKREFAGQDPPETPLCQRGKMHRLPPVRI